MHLVATSLCSVLIINFACILLTFCAILVCLAYCYDLNIFLIDHFLLFKYIGTLHVTFLLIF